MNIMNAQNYNTQVVGPDDVITQDQLPDCPPCIGCRIRALRQAKGLSLSALARLARLSYPGLQKTEEGRTSPRLETLQRIASALQTDVPTLLDGSALGVLLVRIIDIKK